jgi:predicted TIM-barrel fold metal-dependent hydrolase
VTARSFDELSSSGTFTRGVNGRFTLLPDPPTATRSLTIISCDDHVVEPPDVFVGRLGRYQDRAPRVVEGEGGGEVWSFEGQLFPNIGLNAVAGRPVDEYSFEPTRFEHMRPGAWNVAARVRDMDINGVYASLNFPSFLAGFAGQRLQQATDDRGLAVACVRAWNDWMIDTWTAHAPDRFIPLQLPLLHDPAAAADEVRANAARGFKAVAFTEAPHVLGLPSLHTGHWDPLMAACEETGTAVCLHVGSSGTTPTSAPDAPPDTIGALFFGSAMFAAVDWLYSLIPTRFPDLKIVLSEGGIGWVAGLMDRLDHMRKYDSIYGTWTDASSPAEVLRRNFWFCAIDDASSYRQLDVIGEENVMVEADYPHADSTWPDTQELVARQLHGLAADVVDRVTWRNASEVFRHPVPEDVRVRSARA